MTRKIRRLERSIGDVKASLRTLFALFLVITGGGLIALLHWWRDIQGDWLLVCLILWLAGSVLSGLVTAHRFRRLLPWLERRLEQMKHEADAAQNL